MVYCDWSKLVEVCEIFNCYINCWQFEKCDLSLKLCELKQLIVFYIEKIVLIQYCWVVCEGIFEWNKVFEQIGFVNVIEVCQQMVDNEWKDFDLEDMCYVFICWIVIGIGFVMGLYCLNLFIGQIYDGDIVFDDVMLCFMSDEGW